MKRTIFLTFCLVFLFGFIYTVPQKFTHKGLNISVSEPDGNTVWHMCNTYTVKWTSSGIFLNSPSQNLVWVILRRKNDKKVHHKIQVNRAAGECQFPVPCNLTSGDDYFIVVRTSKPNVVKDRSPTFSVKIQLKKKQLYAVKLIEKVLSKDDVSIVQCGNQSDCDSCNGVKDFNDGCDGSSPPDTIAIAGYHHKWHQLLPKATGDDKYKISLKNGWKFKSIEATLNKSSNDVVYSLNPPFPKGKTEWAPTIHWEVPTNNHISYTFKIIVEGPFGTDYK